MGVAMFCSRKLMLTDTINRLQYRLTVLSMRMQGLAMQQVGLLSTGSNSLYGQNSTMSSQSYGGQNGQYPQAYGYGANSSDPYVNNPYNSQSMQMYGGYGGGGGYAWGGGAYPQGMDWGAGNGYNPGDDAEKENQLKRIASIEKVLEIELKALQTQLDMKKKELEAVEKGEKDHIKSITPKYA